MSVKKEYVVVQGDDISTGDALTVVYITPEVIEKSFR
jgi:hypothetical protein